MQEKMYSMSSQNWTEGSVDFQDSTGTTKDTVVWVLEYSYKFPQKTASLVMEQVANLC